MPFLIEHETASGKGRFVVPHFAFYYFISRLGFISFLGFILLSGTQRIFSGRRFLLFLLLFCLLQQKDIAKYFIYIVHIIELQITFYLLKAQAF